MNLGFIAKTSIMIAFSLPPGVGFGASEYIVDTSKSVVQFLAVGKPGFLKIRGEGATLEGKFGVDGSTVTGHLTANLKGLKTGIGLRDEHMHEKYLGTAKFPTAELKINKVSFNQGIEGSCDFEGSLTVKGTEKPVTGSCEASGVGSESLKVVAKVEIQLADFPVGVPSHLGITVAEKVSLEATVIASKVGVLQN